ncbi:MAG: DegT/DnrJ/EryC1/StrS aminotransferase family protein [Candidatus Rokubacteria bacterium]|nr:DegT/DnrJ/EryC1/StrS aminotransferase family protein [Candidatus Rokubacteria bacterium]
MPNVPCDSAGVADRFIPFAPPFIGEEEKQEVLDTLESGWLTTGPRTQRFEHELAEFCGARYAVAVNSCTAALHLALAALGVGEGDEVITSPFTFASTAHVILYQRARPVFVDIEPDTFNLDPAKVASSITSRTRAILPVHYGGHPAEMDPILSLARRHGLAVVEDAAHALGARYRERPVGSMGDVTCFSFYATKNLTTGEGGMLVTGHEEVARRARMLGMYGIDDAREIWRRYTPRGTWEYDIIALGYKYNMMDIQAALGLHQLRRLDWFTKRRAENAAIYAEILGGVAEVTLPRARPWVSHAWHLFPLLLNLERLRVSREQVIECLRAAGVGTSVLFRPLHLHSYYREVLGLGEGAFPVAEDVFVRLVNLPVSPKIAPEEIRLVSEAILRILKEGHR